MNKHKYLATLMKACKLSLVVAISLVLIFPPQFNWALSGIAFASEGSDSQKNDAPEVGEAINRIIDDLSEPERIAKFNEEIRGLHEILAGTRVGIHPLDPFGALSQRIVQHGPKARMLPIRRQNLNIVLGDYMELGKLLKPEDLEKYLGWIFESVESGATLNKGEFKDQIKLAAHYGEFTKLSLDELKHLTKEVADRLGIRADEAVVFLETTYNVFKNPNSPFRKLDRKMAEVLQDFDNDGRVIRGRDFRNSATHSFSTPNLMFKDEIPWQPLKPTFSIFAGGKVVEEFSIPIKAALFYDNYLVLVEPSSYIAEQGIHYITFMDLAKYEASIGKDGLPIFKVPVKTDRPLESIRIENGQLVAGENRYSAKQMAAWSDLNEVFYSSMVNVMDMDKAESAAAKLTDFAEYTYEAQRLYMAQLAQGADAESTSAAGLFNDYSAKMVEALKRQANFGSGKKYDDIAEKLSADFLQARQVRLATQQSAERNNNNRSLLNRTQLLMAHLTLPRPDGIPVLKRAFAHMAAAFSKDRNPNLSASRYLREGGLELLYHPYAKWGLPIVGAALVGVTCPEAASQFLYNMASSAQAAVFAVFGKIYQFGYLGYETVKQTFKGMNPVFLGGFLWTYGSYLMAGGATAAAMVIGPALISHWLVNTIKLGSDLNKMSNAEKPRGNLFSRIYQNARNILGSLNSENFIRQQRELRRQYLADLSSSSAVEQSKHAAKSGIPSVNEETLEEKPKYTTEQTARVYEIINEMRSNREAALNEHWVFRQWNAIKRNGNKVWRWVRKSDIKDAQAIANEEKSAQVSSEEKIQTLRQAVFHFLMSWPTLTVSQRGLAGYFWNSWFLFRSFFFHPIVTARAITQPYYAFTAASDRNQITIPTQFNGGSRWIWEYLRLQFFDTDHLEDLRAWEKRLIPVERAIHKAAVAAGFKATALLARDSKELREIYRRGRFDSWANGAVKGVSAQFRIFFRSYVEGLQEAATQKFLRQYFDTIEPDLLAANNGKPVELAQVEELYSQLRSGDQNAISRLKDVATLQLDRLELSDDEARRLVEDAAKDVKAFENSKALATGKGLNAVRRIVEVGMGQNVLAKLDRKNNRQIDRVFIVNEKLSNAQSVARGVRYVASGWKVSYPLSILSTLIFLSGVDSDMLTLVHPNEMFSDQSFMYLSRYVILGMVLNMVLSVVGGADLWMKVQIDEQHDGLFNERLTGKEAEMKMFELWVSKSFKNPDNTLFKNHMHYVNRIMLPNMKAALFNFALAYFVTVGRFDMGAYLTSYTLSLTLPKYSFDMMMDQGFELASSAYLVSRFPPELVSHPAAQEFINSESGKWRDIYNVANKGYEVTSGALLENLELLKTPELGNRSLERILFNGWSVAELQMAGLEAAKGALRPLPGAEHVLTLCEQMLTNNMPAEMFKHVQVPPWIKK